MSPDDSGGSGTAAEPSDRIRALLTDYLTTTLSRPVDYVGRAPGNSHDGFIFSDASGRKLLARLDPEEGPFLNYNGSNEAALMRQLGATAVPVPAVIIDADSSAVGTHFVVLDWIDGMVYNPGQTKALEPDVRVAMAQEMARMLSCVHSVPVAEIPALGASGLMSRDPSAFLSAFDRTLDQLTEIDSTVLDLVRLWLQGHLGGMAHEVTVVHGDFRLANVVWQGGRIAAVLDWETARVGDPLFDVGWMCMSATSGDDSIMGLVSRDEFVNMYEVASGRRMDQRQVLFWQIAAAWVRGCTELRLLDLALRRDDPVGVEARDLSWYFGSHRTDAELLGLVDQYEAL